MDGEPLPGEILRHYASVTEAARLLGGSGPLERERTQEILLRYLPPAPAVVLDVGGGPGVYALWLAGSGYEVHLVDPVERHVAQALEASRGTGARGPGDARSLASARLGEARALDHDDRSADVVLLLGPLYHLTRRADRLSALREARRVLRRGGLLAVSVISRFASLLDGLSRGMLEDPRFQEIVARDLAEGQHRNPTDQPEWFTTAYFHRPEEIRAELEEAGFLHLATLAVEGPAWLLADVAERWARPESRRCLLGAVRSIEAEPSLIGASAHILALGRRA